MRIKGIAVLTALCLTTALVAPANAQQQSGYQPEIQIDTSVLDSLTPAPGSTVSRPTLSRPAARPSRPMLTAQPRAPEIKGPEGYEAERLNGAVPSVQERLAAQKKLEAEAAARQRAAEQAARNQQAEARRSAEFQQQQAQAMRRQAENPMAQPRQPQAFPIQSKVRTNSFDPSAGGDKAIASSIAPSAVPSQRPEIYKGSGKVVDLTAVELADEKDAPRPGRKPSQSVQTVANNPFVEEPKMDYGDDGADLGGTYVPAKKPQQKVSAAAEKVPPVAATKKPDAVKVAKSDKAANASPVAEQRPAFVPTMQIVDAKPAVKATPPSPTARRSRALDVGVLKNAPKVMPAVPAKPVGVETLPPVPGMAIASGDDPLLMQLKDFDRDKFVQQVEALSDSNTPKPAKKPPKFAKIQSPDKMPPPLAKDNKAIISTPAVLAAPSVTALPKEEDLAALNPAAGGDKFASVRIDRHIPRPPPPDGSEESAFVTVPFLPGDDKATADIRKMLDEQVIPMLQSNPEWRVQIQAFASPDNDVRSSARRTALSRALSVREYLMQKGIDAPRMDVRALGMETDRDPLDRIDMVFFDPATRG